MRLKLTAAGIVAVTAALLLPGAAMAERPDVCLPGDRIES